MIKSKIVKIWMLLAGTLLWVGVTTTAQDDDEADMQAAENDEEMEVLNVIGIRNPNRSSSDSPVPVDIISGASLDVNNGGVDLMSQIANQVPSFNIEQFPIADAATIIRPPNLRGLSSDSTLILVNGKRRHRGAVIALLGGGKNEGSHGVDINAIPGIALERIEILRDGASAQYGSDAVAGVMNFVLRKSDSVRAAQVKASQTYEGDGTTVSLSGVYGLPIGEGGSLTVSADYSMMEATVRSVQRGDAQNLIDAGNTNVREPFAQIWGSPDIHSDFRGFANFEMPMENGLTLYGWGNISLRDVEGGFFFRNPATRSGVFTIDGGETSLIADLGDDSSDCPVVAIEDQLTPDPDALAQVAADPNCYSFLSLFPGGFTPQFGGEVSDYSFAVGVEGMIFTTWNFDASFVWGTSNVAYYMNNTINPQLVDRQNNIPTSYEVGETGETDWTFDWSMHREINVASGYDDIHFATGLVVRSENYVTEQGEEDSWFVNPDFVRQGFGIGSNGFPGYPPDAEVDESRMSVALWVDAEQMFTSNILGTFAMRYEEFEGFGDTLTFKFSTLIDYTENLSIRSGFSTGFIAPTVGQENFLVVSTNFLVSDICPVPGTPCLTDEVTVPATDPIALAVGGERLQPVTSHNTTFGAVLKAWGTDITVDLFRIDVLDRLARTSAIELSPAIFDELEARGAVVDRNLRAVRFFTNNFDTRTEGIEVTAARSMTIARRDIDFLLVTSFIKTTVENYDPAVINEQRVLELRKGVPKLRLTLSGFHSVNAKWNVNGRIRYYHNIWEPHLFSDAYPFHVAEDYLLDLEVNYKFDENTTFSVGLENTTNIFPTGNPWAEVAGSKYPMTAPFGFNGGVAYFRANMNW
ncbi:MAG: TonB-dependent receptor [Gammaproteobacteria bacterium]|nr:TonB-dependent receptor [Gammaproteobacteria bacterium]